MGTQPFSLADDRVYVIAEAGVNHDGSAEKAKRLIDIAADAKADAVKFQMFRVEEIVAADAPLAEYQRRSGEENQYAMLQRLALPLEVFRDLKTYAEEKGLDFLTTPFDGECARFLADLGVKAMKIPSGEITNLPFLESVAALHIPSIISTGMSTLAEVEEAVAPFRKQQTPFALLHCLSAYPAPPQEINLRAMQTLKDTFEVPVGYSDHTEGIVVPIAAAALGARIIEKHFTLSKTDPGPDHAASLEPEELKTLVAGIRIVSEALGSGEKTCQPSESDTRDVARRSIVLAKDVRKGTALTADMLAIKRPGTGLSPKFLGKTIGERTVKDLPAGTVLTAELVS